MQIGEGVAATEDKESRHIGPNNRASDSELIAVRHGQSVANVAFSKDSNAHALTLRKDFRDADIPLSDLGRQQAAILGRWLAGRPPERIYCSPYVRAAETLGIALDEFETPLLLPVQIDERIRDREMGHLELMTPSLIQQEYPLEGHRRRRTGEFRYRPPRGESLADVALRVRSFLTELNYSSGHTLLVCHDAIVLMLRYLTEAVSESDLSRIAPVENAAVSSWYWAADGRLRLAQFNDLSYRAGDAGYSLLDNMEAFELDDEQALDYESAIDAIHRMIGQLSALEWEEEHKADPDQHLLDAIGERTDYFLEARDSLRSTDQARIRAVRQECATILLSGGIEAELRKIGRQS